MNNEIKIRQARPDDATQLSSLAKRGMPGYPFESIYDPGAIVQEIESGSNRIVATNQDDRILGTAVLGDAHMAEIKRVLVDPNARKHGLGVKLTSALKTMAREKGVIAWADVRADQIGMQRAAHHYYPSLTPVSLEMGKHVVYSHGNDGPAREGMVHMSGLDLAHDKKTLTDNLGEWSSDLRQNLAKNMLDSIATHKKDHRLVNQVLPSAQLVKSRIEKNINLEGLANTKLSPDIISLNSDAGSCLIISPDASGFIGDGSQESIEQMSKIALDIGLQIVTSYLAITDVSKINHLVNSGMEPVMIRPWQETVSSTPIWQVGLRRTASTYQDSLHSVNLDQSVYESIVSYISIVSERKI